MHRRRGHCCIEPKGVLATAHNSKAGSTIPVENHDNRACEVAAGRLGGVDEAGSSGLIARCNSAQRGAQSGMSALIDRLAQLSAQTLMRGWVSRIACPLDRSNEIVHWFFGTK
jgi:hypothetical protein